MMNRPQATSSPDVTDSPEVSAKVTEKGREVKQQEARLAKTFEELLGDDEMTDESASDIILLAVRKWRDVASLRSLDSWHS